MKKLPQKFNLTDPGAKFC